MKAILITGGAGFIGSNFIEYFIDRYPEYFIVNIDNLTNAGTLENIKSLDGYPRYKFIKGNICNRDHIKSIFAEHDIQGVIHFAAESHVDKSIENPDLFIQTNVNGTFTLIDTAKNYWMEKSFLYKDNYNSCRFHHISTDEVFGTLGDTGVFSETSPYAPNSPYSASKAAADMIVRSYHHTYGLNTVITNCSNNYGPKQHAEKFIPTIIRKALAYEPIPIYGDGMNIRDWLHVMDHCRGVDLAYRKGKAGETYNIGGKNEKANIDIANRACEIIDVLKPRNDNKSYKELITFVADRPGHDKRYAVDSTKIETELAWKPLENFENGLRETIIWYIEKWGLR